MTDERAAELTALVLKGEKDAYAELVDAYQDRVRARVAGYCRSAEEVEEVCHLAFVEAYRSLESFAPRRGPFIGWLLAIARNCLLSELRRRKAETQRAARYLEQAAARDPDPDIQRACAALEKCMEELTAREASLIEARYRQRRTSEELAAALRKTAGAVRMILQRLRERLRACVQRRLAEAEL